MERFLCNVLIQALVLFTGYALLSLFVNRLADGSNDYMAAIIDKHMRAKSIEGPKMLLVGGSNLAFGVDSEELERQLSVPIVNLGLHGGLGLEFMVNEAESLMTEGDIVVLSIEHYLGEGQYGLKQLSADIFPESSAYFEPSLILGFRSHLERTRNNLRSVIFDEYDQEHVSVYFREGFNRHGDVISHLERTYSRGIGGQALLEPSRWEGIEVLNEFGRIAESRGAEAFFLFPSYAKSEYLRNRSSLKALESDLSQDLAIRILNAPEDFVYDDELFYDTVYHLNAEGRRLRTRSMIQILKGDADFVEVLDQVKSFHTQREGVSQESE